MSQSQIKVDSGTSNNNVDFSSTGLGNLRQTVTIGDPATDANVISIGSDGLLPVKVGSIVNTIQSVQNLANGTISTVNNVITVQNLSNGSINAYQAGAWNIASITNIANGSVNSYQGGAWRVSDESSTVYSGSSALTPAKASIAFGNAGWNAIVATVSSKVIRILSMSFIVNTATAVYFSSGASTNLFGSSSFPAFIAANGGFILPYNKTGWMDTDSGKGFLANIVTTTSIAGTIEYITF